MRDARLTEALAAVARLEKELSEARAAKPTLSLESLKQLRGGLDSLIAWGSLGAGTPRDALGSIRHLRTLIPSEEPEPAKPS